jgi:hypothetical protein
MPRPRKINSKCDVSVILLWQFKRMDDAGVTTSTPAWSCVKVILDLVREIAGEEAIWNINIEAL